MASCSRHSLLRICLIQLALLLIIVANIVFSWLTLRSTLSGLLHSPPAPYLETLQIVLSGLSHRPHLRSI
uniref:Putative secreted protein n=1 Tax=Xenopsylla cheopis TaxID=163159 RepID=A0A6M2DXT5_XENCH